MGGKGQAGAQAAHELAERWRESARALIDWWALDESCAPAVAQAFRECADALEAMVDGWSAGRRGRAGTRTRGTKHVRRPVRRGDLPGRTRLAVRSS